MRTANFTIPALLLACAALSCKSTSEKQLEELFPEMMLEVNLPKANSGKSLRKATEDCSCGYILVGPRKRKFLSFFQKDRDSIFVQVNDVLVGVDEVNMYLKEIRENDRPRVSAFLFVDQSTPQWYVNKLIQAIRSDTTQFVSIYFVTDNNRLEVIWAGWPRPMKH